MQYTRVLMCHIALCFTQSHHQLHLHLQSSRQLLLCHNSSASKVTRYIMSHTQNIKMMMTGLQSLDEIKLKTTLLRATSLKY